MASITRMAVATATLSFALVATAQQQIIYPAEGQSPERQQQDQGECQVWATQSTGIDPAVLRMHGVGPT